VGTSGRWNSSYGGDAQHGQVDHRHALQRPAPGVGRDHLVELVAVRGGPLDQPAGQLVDRQHLRVRDLRDRDELGVGLVEEQQRSLARIAALVAGER